MLENEAAAVRAEVEALGKLPRGKRYPADIRKRAVEITAAWLEAGKPWLEIAVELGLSVAVLQRWQAKVDEGGEMGARAFKPVRVTGLGNGGNTVVVVSPGGYRVEGLSPIGAAALLRALG